MCWSHERWNVKTVHYKATRNQYTWNVETTYSSQFFTLITIWIKNQEIMQPKIPIFLILKIRCPLIQNLEIYAFRAWIWRKDQHWLYEYDEFQKLMRAGHAPSVGVQRKNIILDGFFPMSAFCSTSYKGIKLLRNSSLMYFSLYFHFNSCNEWNYGVGKIPGNFCLLKTNFCEGNFRTSEDSFYFISFLCESKKLTRNYRVYTWMFLHRKDEIYCSFSGNITPIWLILMRLPGYVRRLSFVLLQECILDLLFFF